MSSSSSVSWTGRAVLLSAFLLLAHAGYSALEHVAYLKTIDRVDDGLTTDIILETLISMLLCFVGIALVADPLQELALHSELKKQSRNAFEARPSYHSFGHRARHFSALLAASAAPAQE
ncbi:hypothetical protein H9P43_001839 [Blastocladiella emersonii ATCC 22665]|nr:hypothetical protein H9P43_001839 [Blastocladiella emersonii ATCC 22665]